MTGGLNKNVDDMLARLEEHSRSELDLVRTLSDAIRRVDDQLLRDVRAVTIHHEIRRETIVSELQTLAKRLCALPMQATAPPRPAIDHAPNGHKHPAAELVNGATNGHANGADWRHAAQAIEDDLDFAFSVHPPRH